MKPYCLYGLSDEVRSKLEKIAVSKKWTLAVLIRDILEQYLKKNENKTL